MFQPEKLQKLIDDNKVVKKHMCEDLGISQQGLKDILARGVLPRVDRIEKFADYFKVSLDYFFSREEHLSESFDGLNQLMNSQLEIKYLKSIIKDKDHLIVEKDRVIQLLNSKLKDSCIEK